MPDNEVKRSLRSILNVGPSIVWALLILKLLLSEASALPKFPILFSIPHFDKIIHAILFGVWMATLLWASAKQFHSYKGWKISLILVVILGTSTEVIQEFALATRQGSILDLVADMVGAVLALIVLNRPYRAMIME